MVRGGWNSISVIHNPIYDHTTIIGIIPVRVSFSPHRHHPGSERTFRCARTTAERRWRARLWRWCVLSLPIPKHSWGSPGSGEGQPAVLSLSATRRSPLVLSQANRSNGEAAGFPWRPASFWKSRTLLMAAVGRGWERQTVFWRCCLGSARSNRKTGFVTYLQLM